MVFYGDNKGYITNIRMGDACGKQKTDEVALEITNAGRDTSAMRLEKMSPAKLDEKDKKTYTTIDSLGEKEHFDKRLSRWTQFATGKIPIGPINLDLNRIYNYNHYEGSRVGLGLSTNYKISKRHSLSVYGAYGFKDKAFKYGGDLKLLFYPRRQTALQVSYRNDLVEAAAPPDFFTNAGFLSMANARLLYLRKFDWQEQLQAVLGTRLLRHFHARAFMNIQYRKPMYDYTFTEDLGDGVNYIPSAYYLTQAGGIVRFAFREKFVLADNALLSQGTKFPVLTVKYTRSLNNVYLNDFTYDRWDLMLQKDFKIRNFGRFSVTAQAGKINGKVPYTLLNSFIATFEQYTISVPNAFEGMRMNEFVSDVYGMLFLSHNFLANLFYNTKNQPQVELFTNLGWGTLSAANAQGHTGIGMQDLSKGYYESGLRIHSLIKSKFSRIGVCLGYRYGPYSAGPKFMDNAIVKFTTGFVLD
jgi:hypothetical protein